jgi:hypothetical protein
VLRVKPGVDIRGISPEISMGINVLNSVLMKYGAECMITACRDGNHMNESKHYIGDAVDIRLASRWVTTSNVDIVVLNETRANLGDQFDLILEENHFHLEFDPKKDLAT